MKIKELSRFFVGEKKVSEDSYKTAIFSGRFDPPHIGHIMTILKLAERFGKVVVVVLEYKERESCDAAGAKQVFDCVFNAIMGRSVRNKVDVVVNKIHFGKITFSEYDLFLRNIGACYNHTVYLSGNKEVLENMVMQQIKCEFVPRSSESIYTGTKIRERMEV
jgi:cytidyltransferase-like protein